MNKILLSHSLSAVLLRKRTTHHIQSPVYDVTRLGVVPMRHVASKSGQSTEKSVKEVWAVTPHVYQQTFLMFIKNIALHALYSWHNVFRIQTEAVWQLCNVVAVFLRSFLPQCSLPGLSAACICVSISMCTILSDKQFDRKSGFGQVRILCKWSV
jgi:hypothetical protein